MLATSVRLAQLLFRFARDSTPSQKRRRYGDVDFDWEHRVDTTSATVGWHARFLGLFNSPYQPSEAALFHRMLAALPIDFSQFTFIDVGSGKRRALLLAADYPFRRIIGLELLPELDRIAQENIENYKSDSQRCFAIESVCTDARRFEFPAEALVIYLFNPLTESGLSEMMKNLGRSLREHPRPIWIIYHNPLLEHVLLSGGVWFTKIASAPEFAAYQAE